MTIQLCIMLEVFSLLDRCTVKSRLEVAHEKIRSNGSKAIFLFCFKFFCKILSEMQPFAVTVFFASNKNIAAVNKM